MAWRVAKSLEKLRTQINQASPNRSKSSDGTIGDAAHASRSSDHNPWVTDGGVGVVTAMDITHDPAHGVDAGKIADILRLSGDPRIKYIISNRRIANSGAAWRKYTGSNPHDHHFHVSVSSKKELYDNTSDWDLSGAKIKTPILTTIKEAVVGKTADKPLLQQGSKGSDVKKVQKALGITEDGIFGPATKKAVVAFQKKNKLVADGMVGTYTWKTLNV